VSGVANELKGWSVVPQGQKRSSKSACIVNYLYEQKKAVNIIIGGILSDHQLHRHRATDGLRRYLVTDILPIERREASRSRPRAYLTAKSNSGTPLGLG
jgi:hypothetical protein